MRTIAAGSCLLVLLNFGSVALAKDAPKADDTAQNYGATRSDAVTAEKQGNSKKQVTVLAHIRKAIMAEKGLSMDAKNVKIVYSKNGQVILRGPVDSEEEKEKVGELAKGCDGVSSITNELSVAAKPH
jgi:hyperosmotically inducible periplasmic protein